MMLMTIITKKNKRPVIIYMQDV